jgi:hypothetical protein
MTDKNGRRYRHYGPEQFEDEIELMDYLIVIWKWKYLILAGTFGIVLVAAIISFVSWKQQPTMYQTSIVLKPGVLEIDETGNVVFISSPEDIKALIENDLKHKILDDIMSSKRTKLSNLIEFQVDIPQGLNKINVSLESASIEDGTTKLNYLIKALSAEFTDKTKFFQKEVERRIEEKKYEFEILLLKEKEMKTKINIYEKELSDIGLKTKLLKDIKDISQNKEYMLSKLSVENDYRNTFQIYFKENENAKFNLFELQKKTNKLLKEIEKLEKEEQNIQICQIIQSPVTTELPKSNKIKRNLLLSSAAGFFSMLFLSFFLDYIGKYKKRRHKLTL